MKKGPGFFDSQCRVGVVLQISKSHNHIDDAVIATGTGPITSIQVGQFEA